MIKWLKKDEKWVFIISALVFSLIMGFVAVIDIRNTEASESVSCAQSSQLPMPYFKAGTPQKPVVVTWNAIFAWQPTKQDCTMDLTISITGQSSLQFEYVKLNNNNSQCSFVEPNSPYRQMKCTSKEPVTISVGFVEYQKENVILVIKDPTSEFDRTYVIVAGEVVGLPLIKK